MACCGGGREADEDARLDALLTGHSLGRSVTIAEPERRGITLRQLQRTLTAARARCKSEQWRDGDKPITAEKMSVADVRHRLVQPIVKNTLVEHLARGPQLPSWVVITSWRTPFAELVACLEQHTADHLLDESTTYWLSAFALSPRAGRHDSAELSARAAGLPAKVEEIPFHTALRAASRGALTVVDSAGRTFTDAWLGFEVFTTVASLPASLRHDWYVSPRGAKRPVGLVDGFAAGDKAASSSPDGWLDAKARRESAFPVVRAARGAPEGRGVRPILPRACLARPPCATLRSPHPRACARARARGRAITSARRWRVQPSSLAAPPPSAWRAARARRRSRRRRCSSR